MRTLFLATAAFAALVMVAPIGKAHAYSMQAYAQDPNEVAAMAKLDGGKPLGVADLPKIHSEYAANQARWAHEYLGKTFDATMELERIGNIFSNDSFNVSFKEEGGGLFSGVSCGDVAETPLLLSLNRGDKVHVSGVVADHSVGSVDLKDCEFRVDVSEAVKMQGAVTGAGLY
jgi:hypothetical protein